MSAELVNRRAARIFRITHADNVPWILDHGLHCSSSAHRDPHFVDIGNPDVIGRRQGCRLAVGPGGTLADYVPFYFTPWTPMLHNIKTGRQGVTCRPMSELVILIGSVRRLEALRLPYVISDRHALLAYTRFFPDASGLDHIDWPLLQSRDFRRQDRERFERYQAEVLVHRHVPLDALLCIAVHDDQRRSDLQDQLQKRGLQLKLVTRRSLFL
jgi:ssDNA thymidine ADP-ribosyltransferase, DarT